MTSAGQAVSMKDARVMETEVLVRRPKMFVRELVSSPRLAPQSGEMSSPDPVLVILRITRTR
jgi:hypothetical protein